MKKELVVARKAGTGIGSIFLTLVLLVLPLIKTDLDFGPVIDSLGRFHPIIVHFPIVLVLCTVIFEWLFGSFKGPIGISIINILYQWSLYTSVIAVIAGYFLYKSGDYGGDLITLHFWSGVLVAVLMIWSMHFRKLYKRTHRWRWRQLSRGLLLSAGILVFYAGHQGGSLTHGPDFLTEPIQTAIHQRNLQENTVLKEPSSQLVYQDLIVPAFNRACIKCHNAQNAKSDLDLSTLEVIKAGGKSLKPMIVSGKPLESELFIRVNLPPKHDEFMPPDGKPPLHPAEVQLLYYWIQDGASVEDTLGSLMQNDTLRLAMDSYLPELAEDQLSRRAQRLERLKTGPKLTRMAMSLGLEVRPDENTDSALYTLSMQFPPKIITDETLAQLMPYKDYFSRISFVGADITDEGLFYLGQMNNLQSLILAKSCIKGHGLLYLKDLTKLEMINLSHSDLTNENLLYLYQFPAIRKAYVFNTDVSPEVVRVLDAHMKNTSISMEEGDYY